MPRHPLISMVALALSAGFCLSSASWALPLNDTGIVLCGDATSNALDCPVAGFPGQDAEYGRDALARAGLLEKVGAGAAGFDFTKLDANGNDLPASAMDWSCVRDNVSGLIWEIKTRDGGLHDANWTYTWYNPDPAANGGDAGTQNGGVCEGSACDTQGFVQAVNAQGLCGASDWRMPKTTELLSIVVYDRIEPAIHTDYFPNIPDLWGGSPSSRFWSASPFGGSISYNARFVNVGTGYVYYTVKHYDYAVRLVRVGQ